LQAKISIPFIGKGISRVVDKTTVLVKNLTAVFSSKIELKVENNEVTAIVEASDILDICQLLKFDDRLLFNQLIDLSAIDYLFYGQSEWVTERATDTGFSRAKTDLKPSATFNSRYAVVYNFLSLTHNIRLRLKVFLSEEDLNISSICSVWPNADWYEREAFDLFGVFFEDHPDLRRILTDYGFVGHPMRKDFPLEGHVEMRYDAKAGKCVYEKVDIKNRVVIPKVIRNNDVTSHKGGEDCA